MPSSLRPAPMELQGRQYAYDRFGTLVQIDAQPYVYSEAYCQAQKTTARLSHIRLGFALSVIPFETLRDGKNLEIGPGGGQFMTAMRDMRLAVEGHDVVSSSFSTVTREHMQTRPWDVLFLYDVLEHFVEIDDLWKLTFSHACISFPERPPESQLLDWRHLKPDEHRWHFTRESFRNWATAHGAEVLAVSNAEDTVRTRWHPDHPNICTVALRMTRFA